MGHGRIFGSITVAYYLVVLTTSKYLVLKIQVLTTSKLCRGGSGSGG